MSVTRIAVSLLLPSIFLAVFKLGLAVSPADATFFFRRPGLAIRSLLAMNVMMPVFAVAVAAMFRLHPAVEIALVFLSVSPVPPFLPRQQLQLGGSSRFVYGLLIWSSLLSILVVPLTIELLNWIFGQNLHFSAGAVAKVIFMSILLPLTLGMVIHHRMPELARRLDPVVSKISFLLLLGALVALLIVIVVIALPQMLAFFGDGSALAILVFVVAGIALGYGMGGPERGDRTTLALATASRHPGLAVALASANFPSMRNEVISAVLLYILIKALVLTPGSAVYKRRQRQSMKGATKNPLDRAA
jgi:BASS family bile acid:Na+ symporter